MSGKQQHQDYKAPERRHLSLYDFIYECEMRAVEREKIERHGNGSQPERYCDCRELLLDDGTRLPCPPLHDCAYVRERSRLVPEAVRRASERIGEPTGDDVAYGYRWTGAFNREMDRLSAPLLKQSGNGT